MWDCPQIHAASSLCRLTKGVAMSAVEFGLTSESAFVRTLLPVALEQPLRGSDLTQHYESLLYLSRSIASIAREMHSRDLVALLRPLFPCDFVKIVVLDPGGDGVTWKSREADQLAPLNVTLRETTVWAVYH